MERVDIQSFAKVNLCLDVKGLLPGGYHEVEMILQQIRLHDDVIVQWGPGKENKIMLQSNRADLPSDQGNLAWRAAAKMIEEYGAGHEGEIRIDMVKRIPVAAGLAGGSSNCAAVIHALNILWDLDLDLKELCRIAGLLGSDIPFCVMGQAAADPQLRDRFASDPLACHCAIARGRGTDLQPIEGLHADLILSKPPISVSTAEAYRGIDDIDIPEHPDIEEMTAALAGNDITAVEKNMINVLENFTLRRYPIVVYTKNKMQELCNHGKVLMSGSGPSVFGLCESEQEAQEICEQMRETNRESFCTRTTA